MWSETRSICGWICKVLVRNCCEGFDHISILKPEQIPMQSVSVILFCSFFHLKKVFPRDNALLTFMYYITVVYVEGIIMINWRPNRQWFCLTRWWCLSLWRGHYQSERHYHFPRADNLLIRFSTEKKLLCLFIEKSEKRHHHNLW